MSSFQFANVVNYLKYFATNFFLRSLYLLCVCACMSACVCIMCMLYLFIWICTLVSAGIPATGDQMSSQDIFCAHSPPCFLRQSLSLNLERMDMVGKLISECCGYSCASPCLAHVLQVHVSGLRILYIAGIQPTPSLFYSKHFMH